MTQLTYVQINRWSLKHLAQFGMSTIVLAVMASCAFEVSSEPAEYFEEAYGQEEDYCGRGFDSKECADGLVCDIAANDGYAVCVLVHVQE